MSAPTITDLTASHSRSDNHSSTAGGHLLPVDQGPCGAHARTVGVEPSQPAANRGTPPRTASPPAEPFDSTEVGDIADLLDGIEDLRKRTENRLRALLLHLDLIEPGAKAAKVRTAGAILPITKEMTKHLRAIDKMEHEVELSLRRAMRRHPLGPFIQSVRGLGLKQAGRLIGTIGDPYIKYASIDLDTGEVIEPPRARRGPAELWAYCGYHVIDGMAPARRKGEKANWNSAAKMRAFLCSEAGMKNGVRKLDGIDDKTDAGYDYAHREAISPLGQVYLDARIEYADATHERECKRCGPAGKPAPVGSPLSEGHKHARALRLVSKEILRLLWVESKRLHEEP